MERKVVSIAEKTGNFELFLKDMECFKKDLEAKIYPLSQKAVIILLRKEKPRKGRGKGL